MKQVIYIWNYIDWGGAQIYFFGLIKELKKHTNVKVVLPENSNKQLIKFIENLEVPYEFINVANYEKQPKSLFNKVKMHFEKQKSENTMVEHLFREDLSESIVHIELAPWSSLNSLIRLCRKTNVFITMHNSLPPVPKWRYLLWKAKFAAITKFKNFHIFASNVDAKKSIKPLVSEEFYEEVKVTYTNVNPDEIDEALDFKIDKQKLLEKFDIPKNKFLVFCVGQFIDRKGRWTFLEAAKRVFEKDKDFAFVWIANSKPDKNDLEKAENFGLGENFVLITSDRVGEEHIDLFKLMRLADIFALVSFQEGLPISLLEAMALKIPSISTNVNAIPEAVKHLETGWLIEAGDVENLSNAMLELKNNDNLRQKLSENGRNHVLLNFNEKKVAQIALENYRKALKK